MAMGSSTATLVLKVVTDTKDAVTGLDSAGESVGKFHKGMKIAGAAAAVAGGAIVAFGLSAVNAAAEDAQGQAILANTLKETTGARNNDIAAMEDWISSMSAASGVADDQMRPALGTLLRATGDVTKSQEAMKVAMNLSAATGDDLGTVTDALAKGFAGSTTSLGKLVPGIDKTVLASKDMSKIMDEVYNKTGDALGAAADTAAGKQAILANSLGETKEAIGAKLLPALEKLLSLLQIVVNFIAQNTTLFTILAGVVLAIAAAILVLNVAMKISTAVTWAMNAAWLASPITWIVLGIVALIAVIVIIATKTTWFQDIWNAAWGAIKDGAAAVWNWLKANWPLLLAIITGPIGLAVLAVVKNWDAIKSAAQTVYDWLSSVFVSVWGTIRDAATSALGLVLAPIHAVEDAFNRVIDVIKRVIDWISKIKIPDLNPLNHIPGLSSLSTPAAPTARAATRSGATSSTGGGGGVTINVNVPATANPAETGRAVASVLRSFFAAGGRLEIP